MKDTLISLASRHLGKAGDGTIVKPYETPTAHDKTLLVALPRSLNREKSKITANITFIGYEVWHAYEMSFLRKSGMPCTGVLKIAYPADSEAMVESKSLKLYLNSFDLEKFDSISEVENIIATDLTEFLKGEVKVTFHQAHRATFKENAPASRFMNIDQISWTVQEYRENPDLLFDLVDREDKELWFHTCNLRSNCEITNQKDTGNCYIYLKGDSQPALDSLIRYVISFRDSQHFHENVTEIMYATLMERYQPEELLVANIFNRRGGIDIHSVRGSSEEVLEKIFGTYQNTEELYTKTAQQ
jgi:7-cyano-7-deazaguanine reductase